MTKFLVGSERNHVSVESQKYSTLTPLHCVSVTKQKISDSTPWHNCVWCAKALRYRIDCECHWRQSESLCYLFTLLAINSMCPVCEIMVWPKPRRTTKREGSATRDNRDHWQLDQRSTNDRPVASVIPVHTSQTTTATRVCSIRFFNDTRAIVITFCPPFLPQMRCPHFPICVHLLLRWHNCYCPFDGRCVCVCERMYMYTAVPLCSLP